MAVAVENNFTVEAGGKEIESFILPTTESFVTFMAKKLIDAFAKLLSFWKAVNTLSKFACEKTTEQKKEKKTATFIVQKSDVITHKRSSLLKLFNIKPSITFQYKT